MGYFVEYSLYLKISNKNKRKALEIFNHLHTDEMLLEHAKGGSFIGGEDNRPVRERKWYSWVENPSEPYKTLSEAFKNWGIVEENVMMEEKNGCPFTIDGCYYSKLGQQAFLLEQLAPILKNEVIYVKGEDGCLFAWVIENGTFREIDLTIRIDDDEESDEETESDNDDEEY